MSRERHQVQEGYLPCRESAARPKSQMKPSCPPSVGNRPLPRSTLPVAGAGLLRTGCSTLHPRSTYPGTRRTCSSPHSMDENHMIQITAAELAPDLGPLVSRPILCPRGLAPVANKFPVPAANTG